MSGTRGGDARPAASRLAVLVVCTAAMGLGCAPAFLVGYLGPDVRSSLDLSGAQLGPAGRPLLRLHRRHLAGRLPARRPARRPRLHRRRPVPGGPRTRRGGPVAGLRHARPSPARWPAPATPSPTRGPASRSRRCRARSRPGRRSRSRPPASRWAPRCSRWPASRWPDVHRLGGRRAGPGGPAGGQRRRRRGAAPPRPGGASPGAAPAPAGRLPARFGWVVLASFLYVHGLPAAVLLAGHHPGRRRGLRGASPARSPRPAPRWARSSWCWRRAAPTAPARGAGR